MRRVSWSYLEEVHQGGEVSVVLEHGGGHGGAVNAVPAQHRAALLVNREAVDQSEVSIALSC